MIYDGFITGGNLLCSSCGHDNPRENRYCGMCGTPFPHRFLPVPEEQRALSFPSAPLEIAPSLLPVSVPEPPQPEPVSAFEPVEAVEPAPLVTSAASSPPMEPPVVVAEPVREVAKIATVQESTLAEIPALEPAPVAKEPVHPTELPPVVAAAPPQAASVPPSHVSPEEVSRPSGAPLPEIRKYTTPHRETPPTRVAAHTPTPTKIQRPPEPQTMEPPPDSAGMPTFQSVVEAAGAPPISPFEPPPEKDAAEERELQEFVASFRYNPPDEAVDELTMRSEVPVLDAEAPVTPSHPSFDDDVPPPPEAGPHPTGEEYYPPAGTSADRSHYLEMADTHHAAAGHSASTSATTSFHGLDETLDATPPLDQVTPPARRHWLLWTSLIVLLGSFSAVGFFEGRAQRNHAYRGPVEIAQEQYDKLRQRVLKMTASEPATITDKNATEAPAPAEPKPNPPAADQPATAASKPQPTNSASTSPPASPAPQSAATPDQSQPKSPAPAPPATPAPDVKAKATPSIPPAAVTQQKPAEDTQPKPAPDITVAEREPANTPPPTVAKPKSRSDPGQQELANAMQATDPAAAAAWLWKATSRGNPVAPVRLADMYIKGKGVPHSCEQALVLLRAQAAKEDAAARNRLAALYASGTCVARDRVKAYQLMSSALAVDPSSEWAVQNRKELWQQMTPEERTLAQKYR